MRLVKTVFSEELQTLVDSINEALNSTEKNVQNIMVWANEIRSKELWRKSTAKSYSQFCELQGWSRRRFDQLAENGATLLAFPEKLGKIFPNEAAVKEAGKLGSETAIKAVENVVKRGEKPTAKAIANEAKQIANSEVSKSPEKPKEKEIVRDKTGCPIPPRPLEYWNRRQEVQDFLTAITRLKSQIEKASENGDLLWAGVKSHLISNLEAAYGYAKDAMPYSVCTVCQGYPEVTKCGFCGTLGILPKWRYESQGDDRIRSMREKQYAQYVK